MNCYNEIVQCKHNNNNNKNDDDNNSNDFNSVSSLKLLADKRPTNWGHQLYHSKVDRELSQERQTDTHINTEISKCLQFKLLI